MFLQYLVLYIFLLVFFSCFLKEKIGIAYKKIQITFLGINFDEAFLRKTT